MTSQAKVRALGDLTEGTAVTFRFTVDAARMTAFRELSGDANPIHTDAAFAQARGAADRVVYGGLLVAELSRLIGMELPGRDAIWTGLQIDFHKPVLVGEEVTLDARVVHVSLAARSVDLDFRFRVDGRLAAKGQVSAMVNDGG